MCAEESECEASEGTRKGTKPPLWSARVGQTRAWGKCIACGGVTLGWFVWASESASSACVCAQFCGNLQSHEWPHGQPSGNGVVVQEEAGEEEVEVGEARRREGARSSTRTFMR